MNAEIVSVGTELLLGQIVDTHAATMARTLAACGISCTRRATVGDNLDRLVTVLREALARADIVITIGGLGPTQDDLTRDAIALALDDTLEPVPEYEAHLRSFFTQRSLPWVESISRQATKPTCCTLIDNPYGTAPGLFCQKGSKWVFALPGPKGEFDSMCMGPVRQMLAERTGEVIHSRVLRVVGMGESWVEDQVKDLMAEENPTVAPYAHTGEVHLRVTARARTIEDAERMIEPVCLEMGRRLGKHLYATDSETLEANTVALLKQQGKTIAIAESVTGGALAARFTSVPGVSQVFLGGIVAYTPESKQALAHVPADVLAKYGPVSAEVAEAMASGIRGVLGSDFGLATTGNAGPSSDVDSKPVGLVFVGLADSTGLRHYQAQYRCVREDVQRRAGQLALSALRDRLLEE